MITLTPKTYSTHAGPVTFYRVAAHGHPTYAFSHLGQARRRAWLLSVLTGMRVEDRTK